MQSIEGYVTFSKMLYKFHTANEHSQLKGSEVCSRICIDKYTSFRTTYSFEMKL